MYTTLTQEKRSRAIDLALRTGVAFAFIYPPISAWFTPFSWLGYFPGFIVEMAGQEGVMLLLHAFGIFEIVIGLWILFGKKVLVPSALATLALVLIVLFNWNQMDVLFRDISIALMSLALVLREWPRPPEGSPPII